MATSTGPVATSTKRLGPDVSAEAAALIEKYAADLTPADRARLRGIGHCESGDTQLDWNGKPLYSGYGTPDVGFLQINEVHRDTSVESGMDIDTLEGNIRFGVALYRTEGVIPWKSSKACWSKPVPGW